MKNLAAMFVSLALFCQLHTVYAVDTSEVSFFASNNTEIIKPQQAYVRILSQAQDQLKNTIIDIMQSNHMEQTKCEDSIGMYEMRNDGNPTSDNTKVFTTSPYQIIADNKVFAIAVQMANELKQESVAVFIPDKDATVSDTVVHLKSHQYHLDEILKVIDEDLPPQYSKAFSLHFSNKFGGLQNATVSSIEWLGTTIDPAVIQRVFSAEDITFNHGKAYLVFKNGQKEEL